MTQNRKSRKRTFRNVGHAIGDLSQLLRRPREMVRMAKGGSELSPALREKIMLAVTSVNRCRYCSFVHSRLARREGLTIEEVDALLDGKLESEEGEERKNPEEREILLYARHWAETEGHPDDEVRGRMVETFGKRRTESFETAIRAIMFGNYFGNGFDTLLDKLVPASAKSSPD